jgi:hypothetical protein
MGAESTSKNNYENEGSGETMRLITATNNTRKSTFEPSDSCINIDAFETV